MPTNYEHRDSMRMDDFRKVFEAGARAKAEGKGNNNPHDPRMQGRENALWERGFKGENWDDIKQGIEESI